MIAARNILVALLFSVVLSGCHKSDSNESSLPVTPDAIKIVSAELNGQPVTTTAYNIEGKPVIRFSFTAPISRSSASQNLSFKDSHGSEVPVNVSYGNSDSTVI